MNKKNKIIYWISTCWLALGMLSTGAVQFLQVKEEVDNMTQLGYPLYLLTLLAVWKFFGVVTVLVPRLPLLKEWAYAGFFFAMSGATVSHLASGNPVSKTFPSLLLLTLTVVSWYFRPTERKVFQVTPP
jgi:hypothetical protein